MDTAKRLAARWLTGSVLSGRDYYHGTYLADAEQIARSGFRVSNARGRGAILGPGVYVSAKRAWALSYASDLAEQGHATALLILRVRASRFLPVDPADWPPEVADAYRVATRKDPLTDPVDYPALGAVARRLGYDAVGSAGGTIVVFDPKDVDVVSVTPL